MERSYFDGTNAFHTLRFTAVDSDGGTFEVTFYSPEPVEITDNTKQSNAYPWGATEWAFYMKGLVS